MNRTGIAGIVGLVVALAACNSPKPVEPEPAPVTTPVGTNVGSPVTQAIGTAGGTVSAGGVTVSAPAGAFSSATLSVQPITDTFNGAGQGVAISSDAAWGKYLTVAFPIEATDENPEGLGLAVQQADGSWRALAPVKVDTVAGTIKAGLPALTEATTSSLRAQGSLNLKRVIKFKAFYMKPQTATVKVKGTQPFVPYAKVIEKSNDGSEECKPPAKIRANAGIEDDLAPLTPVCWNRLTNEYPFTNDKMGFLRGWVIVEGSGGTFGTISPSGTAGATYTAPDKKPNPDTVTVRFGSTNTKTLDEVILDAKVKITDDLIQAYTGSVNFNGSNVPGVSYSGKGNLTWKLVDHIPGDLNKYEASGSIDATMNYPECTPVTGSVPVKGAMIVFDPVRSGPGDTFASKYWFSLVQGGNVIVTAQCGDPPTPTQVPVQFAVFTACPEVPTLPTASKYMDIALLMASGTWYCQDNAANTITTTADWNFKAQ